MKVTVIPTAIVGIGYHQRIGTGMGELGNKRTSGDYPKCSSIKIDLNTDTVPGDMRRLTVNQTLERSHQLTLVGKTLDGKNSNE